MMLYGEVSFSIASDLLNVSGMVSGIEADVLCLPEDGGITVGVRIEARGYAHGLDMIMRYAIRAAKHFQKAGLAVPEPYKVTLYDGKAQEMHYHSKQWLAMLSKDDA